MSLIKTVLEPLRVCTSSYCDTTSFGYYGAKIRPRIIWCIHFGISCCGLCKHFDAGLTRAVIREVAIEKDNEENKLKIISSATVVIIYLSLAASLLLFFFSGHIALLLNISETFFS